MNGRSASQAIRETLLSKPENSECWRGYGETGAPRTASRHANRRSLCGKQSKFCSWEILQKNNNWSDHLTQQVHFWVYPPRSGKQGPREVTVKPLRRPWTEPRAGKWGPSTRECRSACRGRRFQGTQLHVGQPRGCCSQGNKPAQEDGSFMLPPT